MIIRRDAGREKEGRGIYEAKDRDERRLREGKIRKEGEN